MRGASARTRLAVITAASAPFAAHAPAMAAVAAKAAAPAAPAVDAQCPKGGRGLGAWPTGLGRIGSSSAPPEHGHRRSQGGSSDDVPWGARGAGGGPRCGGGGGGGGPREGACIGAPHEWCDPGICGAWECAERQLACGLEATLLPLGLP
jgi:hypothetical protein